MTGHPHLLSVEHAGRGLGSDHFPKRGHAKCHHSWVRSFPWARFFDGDICLQKASGHCPSVASVYAPLVSIHMGRGNPRGRFFKISISILSFTFSRRSCSTSSAADRSGLAMPLTASFSNSSRHVRSWPTRTPSSRASCALGFSLNAV